MFGRILAKVHSFHNVVGCQIQKAAFSSNTTGSWLSSRPLVASGLIKAPTDPVQSKQQLLGEGVKGCSQSAALNLTQVRTNFRSYRPAALKRIRKCGLEKRLSSPSQRQILMRKILRGDKNLTVFDRFLNQVPEKKVKKNQRVNLFDKKKGYRSLTESKNQYYRF